jgi:hypothetical protein
MDDLRAAGCVPDAVLSRADSAFGAHCPSVASGRGHWPWRWPAGRGVIAVSRARLMLMMLPLPGGTAPPRPVMALAVGQPAVRRSPVSSCVRRRQWVSRLKAGPAAAAGPGFQARLLSVMTAPGPRGPGRGPGRREFQRSQCCQCDFPCHRCSQCGRCTGPYLW